jgi:hypothetical protein
MRVERGHSGRSARSLVSPRTRRALVAGAWGSPWSPLIRAIKNPAVRMPSRNQSFCSQLWFCRSRSPGGRHGQADQRFAAADLHGRVHRERHIRRNPAPLSRRANLVRTGSFRLSGIAFAVLAACPFRGASGGQWSRRRHSRGPPMRWRGAGLLGADRAGSGGASSQVRNAAKSQPDRAAALTRERAAERGLTTNPRSRGQLAGGLKVNPPEKEWKSRGLSKNPQASFASWAARAAQLDVSASN